MQFPRILFLSLSIKYLLRRDLRSSNRVLAPSSTGSGCPIPLSAATLASTIINMHNIFPTNRHHRVENIVSQSTVSFQIVDSHYILSNPQPELCGRCSSALKLSWHPLVHALVASHDVMILLKQNNKFAFEFAWKLYCRKKEWNNNKTSFYGYKVEIWWIERESPNRLNLWRYGLTGVVAEHRVSWRPQIADIQMT